MPNTVLAKVAITNKDFNFIDVETENRFIPCTAYCNEYGSYTMTMKPETFRDSVIPLFGAVWVLKMKSILDVPFNDDMEIVVNARSICLEQRAPRWQPVIPPQGIRPLVVCLRNPLDPQDVTHHLLNAEKFIMGPICAFHGPAHRPQSWREGIEDTTRWGDEDQSNILFNTEEGKVWIGKAIQASRAAGAVFIRQGYTTLSWDWERLIEGIATRLRPYAPIYFLPEDDDHKDVSPQWRVAWDDAMIELHATKGTEPMRMDLKDVF